MTGLRVVRYRQKADLAALGADAEVLVSNVADGSNGTLQPWEARVLRRTVSWR